jgi:methylglutaconyl-CoA hydratase
MSDSTIRIKVHAPGATVILNRPERRNALSRTMIEELMQALDDLHLQRQVRGIILTGAATAFCAGVDLHEVHETNQREQPFAIWHQDATALRDLYRRMLMFPKPIIAAVNGPALAAGAGLVLACDRAIASNQASFGFPEPRRGLVSGLPAPLLAFRCGGAVAGRLLFSAEPISAEEAARLHLLEEVVADHLLWARATELVQQLAASAPEAIQLTKKHLNETIAEQLDIMLSAGAAASATSRTTEAASEGVAAFVEKREAKWL